MDVTCERCATEYEFDDALVSETGTSVRCTQCGHRFKVKRKESAGAPEVWIVRTVDGSAIEFRALRDLKAAIGAGRVGRDDVLSRGGGRPRRLASIAELEPFFAPTPSLLASTNQGLGNIEMAGRQRYVTPSGLGPVGGSRTEGSVAIPLPTRDERNPVSVRVPPPTPPSLEDAATAVVPRPPLETNPFENLDQDEVTRNRQFTRELHALGEDRAPSSVDPPTLYERDRFPSEAGPKTVAGLAPQMANARAASMLDEDSDSLKKTTNFGTPMSSEAASKRHPTTADPEARKKPVAVPPPAAVPPAAALPPVPAPAPAAAQPPPAAAPVAKPAPAVAAPVAKSAPPAAKAPAKTASAPPAVAAPVAASTPAPSVPADGPSSGRAQVLPPAPDPAQPPPKKASEPPQRTPEPAIVDDEAARPRGGRGRVSLITPTPGESRYSFSNEDSADVMPSGRPTSGTGSRRSAGSVRLIVAVLVCGAMIFIGILLVQRYLPKQGATAASADPRVDAFLEAGDKSFKDGDLDGAKDQFIKASALAETDPRVAKALARLASVRAETAWLELLIVPADDAGREGIRRRYLDATDQAQKAAHRASELAPDDPEIARVLCDVKRLQGDVSGARKLVDRFHAIESQPETLVVLGALDLAEQTPDWRNVIDRLSRAADQEGNLGRARALLVYALARSGDAGRARSELGKLARLPKAHPLEVLLTRFVERSEKGENLTNIQDLPSVSASSTSTSTPGPASSSDPVAVAGLKAAQDALAKGQLDLAEKLYEKIVASEPTNTEGLVGLASVARQRGQAKRAIGIYERVVASSPGNTGAVLALADLKWDSGDQNGARVLYRKALDLGVSGQTADRARERSRVGAGSPPEATTSGGSDPIPTATAPTATATQEPDVPPWEGSK